MKQQNLTVASISILFALIMVSLFFFKEEITGMAFVGESAYTDKVSTVLEDGGSFNWIPSVSGNITSVRISGSLIGNGSARLYLNAAGMKYLLYDTTNKSLPSQITGFIVADSSEGEENPIGDEPSENETDEENNNEGISEEISESGENNTVAASEEGAIENAAIETIEVINATNETSILNETADEIDAGADDTTIKKIAANLAYKSGTEFDPDDDGVVLSDQVVDLTVEATEFSWPVDEEVLCARWEITNLETGTSDFICQGSEACCSLVGLAPISSSWKEPLYLYKSLYSSGSSNMVSAQVVSVELNETAIQLEITQSELASLPVSFADLTSQFNEVCEETCSLPGLQGEFSIELEAENAQVSIANITYTVREQNQDPICSEIPNLTFSRNSEYTLNLAEYCSDPERESLGYTSSEIENISVTITNETMIFVPELDFIGKRFGFLKVSDARNQIISNVFEISVVAQNEGIETKKPSVVVGKPVKWIKIINLTEPSNVTIPIHAEATNITVKKIEQGRETALNSNIKIRENSRVKSLAEYELEKSRRTIEVRAEGMPLITGAVIGVDQIAPAKEATSEVVYTLTPNCFFNRLSLDQIGDFNLSASAKYSTSSGSGHSDAASLRNSLNSVTGIKVTSVDNSLSISPNSPISILALDMTTWRYLVSSLNANLGEESLSLGLKSSERVKENFLNAENRQLQSTTNSTYTSPCFFNSSLLPSLAFLPSRMQSSSVNVESFNQSSIFFSTKALLTFSDKNPLVASDQLTSGNLSICFFNASGIDNVMFGIVAPHDSVCPVKDVEIYKGFEELQNLITGAAAGAGIIKENQGSYNLDRTSAVVNDSILPIFLNLFSYDQNGQLSFNASARYGASFLCSPSNASALGNDEINSSERTDFILISSNAIRRSNSSPESFDLDNASALCRLISANIRSGETKSSLGEKMICSSLPAIREERTMLASTTNSTHFNSSNFFLYFLYSPSFTFLPNSSAPFSESFDLATIDLNTANSAAFSDIAFLAISDQFISGNESISCLRSSGIANVNVGMGIPPLVVNTSNYVYYVKVYKSFGDPGEQMLYQDKQSDENKAYEASSQGTGLITGASIITGFAAAETAQENTTELIIEENITQAEIEYYTEGPAAEEVNISDTKKLITISSAIHYEDILAFTELPREVSSNAFSLFWLNNGSRIKVETTNYDTNNNSLIDYIEWVIPSLSNQTYELSLEILTLHSVATLGENWTVYFNTTGSGNLTISLVTNETYNTTWGEWPVDNETTPDHLRFIDLVGRNNNESYQSVDHSKELDTTTNKIIKIKKEGWNYTEGVLINEWLIEDYHAIQFNFSGIIAYALNAPPTHTAPVLNSTDTSTNNTNQNLTCYNQTTAGDGTVNVTNIFAWYKNGAPNVSLNILNGTALDRYLVAWWPFDNDYYDYALANNGTRNGDVFINKSGGSVRGGGAAQFDGTGDSVAMTNDASVKITANLSVEAWVRPFAVTSQSTVVGKLSSSAGGLSYRFIVESSQASFEVSADGNGFGGGGVPGGTINAGSWYHLVGTYAPSSAVTLYVNGAQAASDTSSITASIYDSDSAVYVGSRSDGSNLFNGIIDDVRIYRRTLTATEAYQHYIAGLGNHTEAKATMLSNFTTNGDTWTCEVTPIDYLSLGSPLNSSNITILASVPPTHTAPVLNSTDTSTNNTNQNLTCYNQSTAGSSFNITNTFTWYKNGVLNASSGIMNGTGFDIGLVAWWPLDNNPSDYVNASDGNLTGGATVPRVNRTSYAMGGGSYSFDAIDDYIYINYSKAWNFTGDFAIEAWAKSYNADISNAWGFISGWNSSGAHTWALNWYYGSGAYFYYYSDALTIGNFTNVGGWNYVAVSRINGTLKGYMNANETVTKTFNTPIGAANQLIMGSFYADVNPSYLLRGELDEIKIYRGRGLTDAEIYQHYVAGLGNHTESLATMVHNFTTAGDTWTCEVTPVDYVSLGSPLNSSNITIIIPLSQSAPILNSTDTSTNNTNQNLTCFNQSTKSGYGYNVTNVFTWYKNGVLNASQRIMNGTALDNNLVVWLPFDNDYYDYAGPNDGNVTGTPLINRSSGGFKIGGGAAQFNGSGNLAAADFLTLNTTSTETFNSSNRTIIAWFRKANAYALLSDAIAGRGDSGSGWDFHLQVIRSNLADNRADKIGYTQYNCSASATLLNSTTRIQDTNWHHVAAIRYSNDTLALYLDGVFENSTVSLVKYCSNSSSDFRVGYHNTVTMNGSIDEFKVYNRSLTEAEIYQDYITGVGNHTDSLATMLSNFTKTADTWTCEVTPVDYVNLGTPLNSSIITIGGGAIYPKWSVQNVSGNNIASIDNAGNMFIVGTKTENINAGFSTYNNTFVIINSSGTASTIINQSGLYLADTVAENIAIASDVPKNSLIIQNASDTLAYFSDTGNLTLRGTLTQSYANP